jgi:restriction system protein
VRAVGPPRVGGPNMPIRDYQQLMLPVLMLASDGREHTNAEAAEKLAAEFTLTDADRREMLPSGQTKFSNRVGWARTYLGKASLLESAGRAKFKITKRGRDLLATDPPTVTNEVLERYAEFREFRERAPQGDRSTAAIHPDNSQTPEEVLAATYQTIRRSLADDLLKKISRSPPSVFRGSCCGPARCYGIRRITERRWAGARRKWGRRSGRNHQRR